MKYAIIKTTVGTRAQLQERHDEYVHYLETLRARQVLVGAGTYDDRAGGVVIVETATIEDAIAIAGEDPLVKAGIETYQVRGWLPTLAPLRRRRTTGKEPEGTAPVPLAQLAPLDAPPVEEGFTVVEADGEHAERLVVCLLPNLIEANDPLRVDYLRRARPRGLRKLLLLYEGEVAGQIEFAPPEASGLPVEGEGVLVVHCLWVVDAFTGLAGGQRLLAACAEQADVNVESLATVAYNANLPFLPCTYFERQGFEVLDQVETGRFYGNTPIVAYLMWRPVRLGARFPTWHRERLLEGVDFCPCYPWLLGKRLYWGRQYSYHGQLVKEGLRRPELLSQLPVLASKRVDKWTVTKVGVPEADLTRALELMQNALIAEPTYYAHVYDRSRMIIVFPDRIFHATRDPSSWREATRYGLDKGIPEEELIFSPMQIGDEELA